MADDAFLDVVGTGATRARRLPVGSTPPAFAPRKTETDRGARATLVLAPVLAMLVALGVVAATGWSRRSGVAEALEPYTYGFFLDRYPLFAFALVYGVARIVAVASGPGSAGPVRRGVFALMGVMLLLLAALYPTFGGLILRGGFATGGMAFLTGQPLWLAYALGAGIAATMFGGIVGAACLLANRPLRPRLRRFGRGSLAFLCIWFGAGIVGLAKSLGFGPWPARAMLPAEAVLAAVLLALAVLPHVVLATVGARRDVS